MIPPTNQSELLTVRVSREIKATREAVFDAWVIPELRCRWWKNYKGEPPTHCEIDGRVGGRYCVRQIGGGTDDCGPEGYEWEMSGEFVEFDRPSRLAFTWNVNHPDERETDQLVTIEFEETSAGTRVTIIHERIIGTELRDGINGGWTNALVDLAGMLQE